MLCEHTIDNGKETIDRPLRRTGSASADSVVGSTTVLNDLILSETVSHQQTLNEESQSLSMSLNLNLWKKGKSRQGAASVVERRNQDIADNKSSLQHNDPPEHFAARDRSNGSLTIGSNNPSPKRSSSCISTLTEGYSTATSRSRSTESSSSQSSADVSPSARNGGYSRSYHSALPMRRRESTGSSDNYTQSHTRSYRTRQSSASSGISDSEYSSDSSESESSFSQDGNASFLLKLKETVSTAAFSRTTPESLSGSGRGRKSPFVRKMTRSEGSGGGPKNDPAMPASSFSDVASMFGFAP